MRKSLRWPQDVLAEAGVEVLTGHRAARLEGGALIAEKAGRGGGAAL
jgi:hypothetical protein